MPDFSRRRFLKSSTGRVWDELPIAVTNDSDLRHGMAVLAKTAGELLGDLMRQPAEDYRAILAGAGLNETIAAQPQVFASSAESWTDLSIRYLVPARERRRWKSELVVLTGEVLARPENASRIRAAYPRRDVKLLSTDAS
jgi:hypothetical protein